MNKFQKRFEDPFLYAQYELELTEKYMIPRFKKAKIDLKGKKLLDIGCGWGGSTVAFQKRGCICEGFDLSNHQLNIAKKFDKNNNINFFIDDICNPKKVKGKFDIILLRDVMEYVKQPLKVLINAKALLKDNGILYITFPPWYSPYGGNQHHPKSITKFMPYVHLLPKTIFFSLLRTKKGLMFKDQDFLEEIKRIRDCKISISKFESLVKKSRLKIKEKKLFISRPAFKIRMGLPIINSGILGKIPLLNELITTGAEYFLKNDS
jgi:SAM-dependent methyltransferase